MLEKLIENLEIYGFGSYFLGLPKHNDVDILIVHRSGSFKSCQFAIQCKSLFVSNTIGADVTILSQSEEEQFSFITKSSARHLGKIDERYIESDLSEILKNIREIRGCGVISQRNELKT